MVKNKKKLIIFGASGFFGINACLILRKHYSVYAVINKNDFYLKGIKKIYLKTDIIDITERIIKEYKPDLIINAIGFTDIDRELKYKEKLIKLNFDIPNHISKISNKYSVKFIHISTDQLYGDNTFFHKESQKPNPVNLYGLIKYKAEKKILFNDKNTIIVRTNFFGCNRLNKNNLFNFIYENLKNNKKIYLFDDIFFTPVYIKDLINIISKLISLNFKGIINIASNKSISKYEFAEIIANKFNFNPKLLIKTNTYKKKIFKIKRSKNMSLSNQKLKKIIHNLDLDIIKSLDNFKSDLSNGFFKEITNHMNYSRHYIPISTINRLSNVLKHQNLTQGNQISEFEKKFSEYVGSKYSVAVSSCTAGLHISAKALGLSSSNCLLTSPNTFVSSANVAYYLDSNVYFCDIDPNGPNINISDSIKIISNKKNKIKIFMPIHYSGIACDLTKFQDLRKKDLYIIEDAAHALGSTYKCGNKVGSCVYSDVTVFSFHPVKSITTGEGGMITTNNKEIYEKLLMLRTHGINQIASKNKNRHNQFSKGELNPWYFEMQDLGFHYRITDIQAAIGIEQLKLLEDFISKRRLLSFKYIDYFKNSSIKTYDKSVIERSSCHLFNIRINFEESKINKANFINELKKKGIGCQVHYIPVPLHPFYQDKGFNLSDFPNTKKFYNEVLSIPLFYTMSQNQQKYVKQKILEATQ